MSLSLVRERPDWVVFDERFALRLGQHNVLDAQLVDMTATVIEHGRCFGGGYLGPGHWLTINAGLSQGRARQVANCAEHAGEFPAVMGLFRDGKLALDQVNAAMTAPPWADQQVADLAPLATVYQIRKMIRTIARPAPEPPADNSDDLDSGDGTGDGDGDGVPAGSDSSEPNATATAARTAVRPQVSFGYDEHGHGWVHAANLGIDQMASIEAALNEARDHLFRNGHPDVTWADALVEIARRSLDNAGTERADRHKAYIHINTSSSDLTATLNGMPLPDSLRDYLLCDSSIGPVWEHDNTPVGVGRTTRTIPNRLRRLLIERDQGCCVPGCTNTLGLQAHHIIAWADGGHTDYDSLVMICDPHHHQHHQGHINISGNPNIAAGQPGCLTITTPDGQPLRKHPTPQPPNGRPPPPADPYKHPLGETCDYNYVSFNRPPPHQTGKPPPAA